MFAGEHPGPVGIHGEVPTRWSTAVQAGPGDDGSAHMTECILFGESRRARRKELLWFVSIGVILLGVVLLR